MFLEGQWYVVEHTQDDGTWVVEDPYPVNGDIRLPSGTSVRLTDEYSLTLGYSSTLMMNGLLNVLQKRE